MSYKNHVVNIEGLCCPLPPRPPPVYRNPFFLPQPPVSPIVSPVFFYVYLFFSTNELLFPYLFPPFLSTFLFSLPLPSSSIHIDHLTYVIMSCHCVMSIAVYITDLIRLMMDNIYVIKLITI